mmetsp:Transcript_2133/g.3907  ORF Transcript_2133/g.3907 Transcript_2133/m.3907 type:complete len:249 (+) Transcript_2133:801-1547(+)
MHPPLLHRRRRCCLESTHCASKKPSGLLNGAVLLGPFQSQSASVLSVPKCMQRTALQSIQGEDPGSYPACNTGLVNPAEKFFIKFHAGLDSYVILVTNCIRVWYRHSTSQKMQKERRKYAKPMKKQAPGGLMDMLKKLLTQTGQSDSVNQKEYAAVFSNNKLTIKATMHIGVFPLTWEFHCKPFGTRDQQALLVHFSFISTACFMLTFLTSFTTHACDATTNIMLRSVSLLCFLSCNAALVLFSYVTK